MSAVGQELLAAVRGEFDRLRAQDQDLMTAYRLLRQRDVSYKTVNNYAIRLGELLSQSLRKCVTPDALPDGKFYLELAREILGPLLTQDHDLITAAATTAQNELNKAAKIGLKAVRPKLNKSRVEGLASKISSYESYDEAAWLLDEPIVNFSQSVVDDTIDANVEAHWRAGLSPVVKRIQTGGACKWCAALAGVYDYPVDREVYRRHERCRCIVLYDPGDGTAQNAHTKIVYASAEKALRDERRRRVEAAEMRLTQRGG